MDAIALLCTLHADGPTTLKRLRQANCSTLDGLEALDIDRLAAILSVPPAGARRFLREARNLRERIGTGSLEREEVRLPDEITERPAADVASLTAPSESESVNLGFRDQRILDRVLETWRERDAQTQAQRDDASGVDELAQSEAPVADAHARGADVGDRFEPESLARDNARIERPMSAGTLLRAADGVAPANAELRLEPHCIDGLDAPLCASLIGAGVHTLADLARCDPLALARELGSAYTHLARLRSLARRAFEPAAPLPHTDARNGAPAPLLPSKSYPERESTSRMEREGPGGPFA